jgi:DNA-binding CsgD family transcriptional regulator
MMTAAIDRGSLIDLIYESAFVPEKWADVLNQINIIAGLKDSLIFSFHHGYNGLLASSAEYDAFIAEYFRRYPNAAETQRSRRLVGANHAGFLTEADVYTEDELLADEIYADFLIPNGYGRSTATSIWVPSGEAIIIHVEGDYRDGPVDRRVLQELDLIRPHLARASLLYARLGLERAKAAAETLEALGLAGAVLGGTGRVVAANRLFEAYIPGIYQDRRSRLTVTNPHSDKLLEEALESIDRARGDMVVRSIPVPGHENHAKSVLHVVPVRRSAHDLFSFALAIVVVTPVSTGDAPDVALIRGLFDLTPAEAKVTQAIAGGVTVAGYAAAAGVSVQTARSQLKHALSKAGVSRQAELVGLLQSARLGGTTKP